MAILENSLVITHADTLKHQKEQVYIDFQLPLRQFRGLKIQKHLTFKYHQTRKTSYQKLRKAHSNYSQPMPFKSFEISSMVSYTKLSMTYGDSLERKGWYLPNQ